MIKKPEHNADSETTVKINYTSAQFYSALKQKYFFKETDQHDELTVIDCIIRCSEELLKVLFEYKEKNRVNIAKCHDLVKEYRIKVQDVSDDDTALLNEQYQRIAVTFDCSVDYFSAVMDILSVKKQCEIDYKKLFRIALNKNNTVSLDLCLNISADDPNTYINKLIEYVRNRINATQSCIDRIRIIESSLSAYNEWTNDFIISASANDQNCFKKRFSNFFYIKTVDFLTCFFELQENNEAILKKLKKFRVKCNGMMLNSINSSNYYTSIFNGSLNTKEVLSELTFLNEVFSCFLNEVSGDYVKLSGYEARKYVNDWINEIYDFLAEELSLLKPLTTSSENKISHIETIYFDKNDLFKAIDENEFKDIVYRRTERISEIIEMTNKKFSVGNKRGYGLELI